MVLRLPPCIRNFLLAFFRCLRSSLLVFSSKFSISSESSSELLTYLHHSASDPTIDYNNLSVNPSWLLPKCQDTMFSAKTWTPFPVCQYTNQRSNHSDKRQGMNNNSDLANSVQALLHTKLIGRRLYYYPNLSSTMDTARKIAEQRTAEGTVVITDKQTAARGRLGRSWLSPEGSLAMSIILQPSLDKLSQLVMISSLAVVRAISKVTGLESMIKWPNDVLIDDKKVCGILIESVIKGGQLDYAIIGIGINVNFDPSAFPEISEIATSLSCQSATEVSKTKLIPVLLSELEHLYLEAQAGAPLYRDWQEKLETLGKWIQVKSGETVEQGIAEATTEKGNLVLRRSDGSLIEIASGDVTVIKS